MVTWKAAAISPPRRRTTERRREAGPTYVSGTLVSSSLYQGTACTPQGIPANLRETMWRRLAEYREPFRPCIRRSLRLRGRPKAALNWEGAAEDMTSISHKVHCQLRARMTETQDQTQRVESWVISRCLRISTFTC